MEEEELQNPTLKRQEDENTEANGDQESSVQEKDLKANRFHVNRELIPVAQLNENLVPEELRELGLDVFNQDDFEQGISLRFSML